MKLCYVFAMSIALLAVCGDSTAQTREAFSVRHLAALQRISDPQIAPDGKSVVFTVREADLVADRGRTDLWLLDLADKTAQPRRLTSHPENDSSAQWSADSRHLYFLSNRSGSAQVWRLNTAGGEAEPVTRLPLDVGSFKLAPNGNKLAVTVEVFPDCDTLACTSERLRVTGEAQQKGRVHDRIFARHWDSWSDSRISRLYIYALLEGRTQGDPVALSSALDADVPSKPFGDASDYTFSPDSSKVVFATRVKGKNEPWSTNFDLYEVSIEGGEPRNLTADNPAWDAQPMFSADGQWLAWRAMQRPGFEADRFRIMLVNLKTGERRGLTENWDRSVDTMAFSADSKTLYAAADHFGQHPLWSIDIKSGKTTPLTGPGFIESFSVGERDIVFSVASLKSPAELQALALRGGELRDLPRLNSAALASFALGEPEQFTFAGANGDTVYAHIVKPANFDPGKRYPIAFFVHGGPQSSFGNAWSYRWNPQTYAGAGYAFIAIDFHGSPGYGQAFTDSISGDWGGKPLEDLQKGYAAALQKYPWLDSDRACALGASYGGYMINWMAGHWAEPFKCFVNHAGIFDNRFMSYSTEELWFSEWEFGGAPYDVPEKFEKHNPVNHVAQWTRPMLVLHGQLDYRVPYSQGLATFTALQRRGIPSRLVVFPNENHWVLRPSNSIQWHGEVEKWLATWLKADASNKRNASE